MNVSSQHPDTTATPKWHWLIAAFMAVLFWRLPLKIFMNLDRGLDLADTGHYYNTLSQFPDIESLSSQYFLFWQMLPIGEGVYENRVWVFGLFLLAGGIFSFGLTRFLNFDYRKRPEYLLVFLGAWASVFSYYFWWLPDPSYNAVAVILLYALAGLVMWITAMTRTGSVGRIFYALAVLAGFLLMALALTRATSSLVFLGLAFGFYGIQAGSIFTRRTLLLAFYGVLGGALFLLLVQVFIEPLTMTFDRQMGGLEMRQIRGRQSRAFAALPRFACDAKAAILSYWPWLLAGVTGAVFSQSKYVHSKFIKHVLLLMSCAGFVGMAVEFALHFMDGKYAKDVEISSYLLALTWSLFVVVIITQIRINKPNPAVPKGWFLVLCLLMVLPFCFAFGTGNLWMKQSLLAGGFAVSACLVALVSLRKSLPIYWLAGCLLAVLLVPYGIFVLAQNKPYRLPEPLSKQTMPVSIRGGEGGTVFVDADTAKFLNDFAPFYDQIGVDGKRSHLIDMSGMSPFLHYHLDAKIMTVPWLIATEKNSQATFEFILARMGVDEIRDAWVITAPDNKHHLDGAALRAIGLNFPDDYELILTSRPPLSKKDIHLYRPKAITKP